MRILSFLALIVLLVACQPKSNKQGNAPAASAHIPHTSAVMMLDNIALPVPDGWNKSAPQSSMRVAQLSLASNPEVEMAVFFFGEQDMVQENIDRWKSQFTIIDSYAELKSDNPSITAVKILGTFKLKTRPMDEHFTETPDYGTLAAIIPSKSGPYYIKLTAGNSIIETQQSAFMQMLNTCTINE